MAKGFEINKRAIRKMTQEIQREFDKNPVRVPIEGEAPQFTSAGTTINYNGPVVTINGDHAQLAWNNENVQQSQAQDIAPGYEALATALTDLIASLPSLGLPDVEQEEARGYAEGVLAEVVKKEPDPGPIRQGVNLIRGLLAPIALGIKTGVADESAEATRAFIDLLSTGLPF